MKMKTTMTIQGGIEFCWPSACLSATVCPVPLYSPCVAAIIAATPACRPPV